MMSMRSTFPSPERPAPLPTPSGWHRRWGSFHLRVPGISASRSAVPPSANSRQTPAEPPSSHPEYSEHCPHPEKSPNDRGHLRLFQFPLATPRPGTSAQETVGHRRGVDRQGVWSGCGCPGDCPRDLHHQRDCLLHADQIHATQLDHQRLPQIPVQIIAIKVDRKLPALWWLQPRPPSSTKPHDDRPLSAFP
jgi:hypothetical protein